MGGVGPEGLGTGDLPDAKVEYDTEVVSRLLSKHCRVYAASPYDK